MFEAKAGAEEDFVRAYGPDGDWAQLFRRSGGGAYLDSQLARDIEIARRFVTIDRWASRAAVDAFKASAKAEDDAPPPPGPPLPPRQALNSHFATCRPGLHL